MNVLKFKAKLVEKGMNVSKLSEILGLDTGTVYRKMNNSTFTTAEVNVIIKALDLTENDVIFIFCPALAEMRNMSKYDE